MKFQFDTRGLQTVLDLNDTKCLFSVLERELKNANHKAAQELDRDTIVVNEEDHGLLRSMLGSLELQSQEQEQSLRATEIIRLFIIFEGHLKSFCQIMKNDKNLSLGINDFSGDLIERAKRFLCDYARVIEKNNPTWHPVHSLQKMRNHLVHSAVDRTVDRSSDSLTALANSFNRFPDLIASGELILSRELCDYLHESVCNLFKFLFETQGWSSFNN